MCIRYEYIYIYVLYLQIVDYIYIYIIVFLYISIATSCPNFIHKYIHMQSSNCLCMCTCICMKELKEPEHVFRPTRLPYFQLAEVLPGDGDFKMDEHCNLEEMNGILIIDTSRHFLLLNHGGKVKVAKPNPYKKKTCESWWLGKPFKRPFKIFDLLVNSGKTRSLAVPISQFGTPQGSKKRHTDRGRRGVAGCNIGYIYQNPEWTRDPYQIKVPTSSVFLAIRKENPLRYTLVCIFGSLWKQLKIYDWLPIEYIHMIYLYRTSVSMVSSPEFWTQFTCRWCRPCKKTLTSPTGTTDSRTSLAF